MPLCSRLRCVRCNRIAGVHPSKVGGTRKSELRSRTPLSLHPSPSLMGRVARSGVGGSSPRMKQPHPSRRSRRSRCATLPTEDGGRDEDLRCLGTVGNDKRGHNQAVIASASEAIHRVDTKQESWTASSRSLLAMTNLKAGGRLVDENVGSQVWHDQCVGLLDPLARDDRAMAVGSILRRNRNCDACHILHSALLISFYSLAVLLAG